MALCIDNRTIDPCFNLAAEEYMIKNFTEDVFMVWQNEPSVIIGKNQYVWNEINDSFVKERDIKVLRRFTGGGAVYHDSGNVNLTFIEARGTKVDFSKYTRLMQEFLKTLDVTAEADQRHTLTVNDLKISGSAQCIYKQKVMYHATLLFSSDLDTLITALMNDGNNQPPEDVKKYVESKRSRVTNISEHLSSAMTLEDFKTRIYNYFLNQSKPYQFNERDLSAIKEIAASKYATNEWNYNTI